MKAYPKKTRFCIWGFGITGRSLASALSARGYRVSVVEDRPEEEFEAHKELIIALRNAGVQFYFRGHRHFQDFIARECDVLSPSPGIPIPHEIYEKCNESKIHISGELEIAHRLVAGNLIAITGTDGKTTVATLIYEILREAGFPCHLVGNIGTPYIDLVNMTKPDHWIVVEVSSYQLETVRLFRPNIAVLLNIAEDHLSRHGDMRTYMRIKGRIFERQREKEIAVLNFDDPSCLQAYGKSVGTIRGFSLAGRLPDGAWRDGDKLMLDGEKSPQTVLKTTDLNLVGEHNHSNVLAAILACSLAGAPVSAIKKTCMNFKGLPHRIETICEVDGVRWVNDSKATNVHAAISAIKCFKEPVVLILGGYEKGLDITELIPYIERFVKHAVLMGSTRTRFKRALRETGYTNITLRKTLSEACAAAQGIAKSGDVVLLSPASSSFDQFKSYVERGNAFRNWVEKKVMKSGK